MPGWARYIRRMHESVIFHAPARTRGFTLIELMVTVAVLVVLATVAVPGLQEYAARSGMASIRNDFSVALQRARADAISRNTCVSLCQLAAGSQNTCAAAGGNWHEGWIVHVNAACNGVVPTAALAAGDIIAVRQPGNGRYQLTQVINGTPDPLVTFDARGTLVTGGLTFRVADAKVTDGPNERDIVMNMQGRVAIQAKGKDSPKADVETAEAEGE